MFVIDKEATNKTDFSDDLPNIAKVLLASMAESLKAQSLMT